MTRYRQGWNSQELQQAYKSGSDLVTRGRWRETVSIARSLLREDPIAWRSAVHAGGLLIEAAPGLGRRHLLREAIRLIESVLPNVPDSSKLTAHYNLANGYLALGQLERGRGPATRPSLSPAITHLDEALTISRDPNIRINLASALSSQGRMVEALDEYNEVIRQHPKWHEAYANRAVALEKLFQCIQPHQGLVEFAANDIRRALELAEDDTVRQEQYREILLRLDRRTVATTPITTRPSRVAEWIWRNGLGLNLCPFCAIESPEAFDQYALSGFLSNARRPERSEPILDMLNAIHRSYGVARWQLLQGAGVAGRLPRDHVVIQRGSMTARHDLRTGLVLAAASGFYGVLNQVASALNAYFGLQHDRLRIDLARVWWPAGAHKWGVPRSRSDLHPRLQRRPYLMLSALHRLALSFEYGTGRYAPLRQLRNNIEHHVVVVSQENATTRYYESVDASQLGEDVITLGRIARAALLYLGGALRAAEYTRLRRNIRPGTTVTTGTRRVERT